MPGWILDSAVNLAILIIGFALGLSCRKSKPAAQPVPPQQAGNALRSTAARERAAKACQLMQTLPTADVVAQCGYGSTKSMMAALRRYNLKSPTRVQDGKGRDK